MFFNKTVVSQRAGLIKTMVSEAAGAETLYKLWFEQHHWLRPQPEKLSNRIWIKEIDGIVIMKWIKEIDGIEL